MKDSMYLLPFFLLINLFVMFNILNPFSVGPFYILPIDFAYFLIIANLARQAFVYPQKFTTVLKDNLFLTVFLALIFLYILFYTPVYGQSAIGEARKYYFCFLLPLFALLSVKKTKDLRKLISVVVFIAIIVALIALGRTAMSGSFVRAIDSEATLMLAFAIFSLLILRLYGLVVISANIDRFVLGLFSVIVIGCGQRSVWLMVGTGLILTLWLYRRWSTFVAKMAIIAIATLAGLAIVIAFSPDALSPLAEQFSGITDPQSDKNASWRIEGWRQQLGALDEREVLFGKGLGNYYSWQLHRYSIVEDVQPHNAYVQMILKFGLLGLTIYILLACAFFRKMFAVRKTLAPGLTRAYVDIGILNFGAAQVYVLGYGFVPIILIYFSLAVTAAKLHQQTLQEPRRQRFRGDLRKFRYRVRPFGFPKTRSLF